MPKEVTNGTDATGVNQEYPPFLAGRRWTLTDARLFMIAQRWHVFSEETRNELETVAALADIPF